MKYFTVLGLTVALLGCSADDRQYLLTYGHPEHATILASSGSPIQATSTGGGKEQGATAPPTAAPTLPVIVQSEPAPPASPPDMPLSVPASATPAANLASDRRPPAPAAVDVRKTEAQPTKSAATVEISVPPVAAESQETPIAPVAETSAPPPPPKVVLLRPPPPRPSVTVVSTDAAALAAPTAAEPPPPLAAATARPVESEAVHPPVPAMVRPAPPAESVAPAPTVTATAVLSATGAAAASIATTAIPPGADAHCKSVADQRRRDAAANGYDDASQQQIYDGTYKNCADWAAKHP